MQEMSGSGEKNAACGAFEQCAPRSFSKARIEALRPDCDRWSISAARVKFPSSATAAKCVSFRESIQ